MNKKIIIFFILSLIFFVIFNYKIFLWTYYFNSWKSLYDKAYFSWSYESFSKVDNSIDFVNLNYNLWNSLFKIWESFDDNNLKIEYYTKSLNSYSQAIKYIADNNLKDDEDLLFNYEFVKAKLNKLKKEEEKKQEEQKEEKNESEENNDEKDSSESSEWNNNQDNSLEENDNTQSISKQENIEKNKVSLSDWELEDIENYLEKLKEEENNNKDFYNNYETNSFFDDFMNSNEKDW